MHAIRDLASISATTDFHSSLSTAPALLAHLEDARSTSLIVDCGDFFEGTGFYRVGAGSIETRILDRFYDVLAPGNHGWRHYLSEPLRSVTVCANVTSNSGSVFNEFLVTRVGGSRVGVTGVIGTAAFATIPSDERAGQRAMDPVKTLNALYSVHRRDVDSWVLLSHSGFEYDLELAEACPWLDVIFSGHCHSPLTGPALVGSTAIIKAAELGLGVAIAARGDNGWAGTTAFIPPHGSPNSPLAIGICQSITAIAEDLAEPVGPIRPRWANAVLDRYALARDVAATARDALGAQACLINVTVLRERELGAVLHRADLLAVEPFDASLTLLQFPVPQCLAQLTARLEEAVGPVAVVAIDPQANVELLATTAYLADTFFPEFRRRTVGPPLASIVTDLLCERRDEDVEL